jgi:hypothetical protein
MFSPVPLSSFLALIILLLSSCHCPEQQRVGGNPNENRNTNENAQVTFDPERSGDLIEIDFYQWTDGYLGDLMKKICPKLGLAPLAKSRGPSEGFEFRLWTDLAALPDPKMLGVRSLGNQKDAYFFNIEGVSYAAKSRREHLAEPKSGWNNVISEVRNRLTTPKGLVREPQLELGRDEPLILLEVLDKGDYRRVFYGKNTTFADGKRLIEVCDYLASEFDVDMDCRQKSATPQ